MLHEGLEWNESEQLHGHGVEHDREQGVYLLYFDIRRKRFNDTQGMYMGFFSKALVGSTTLLWRICSSSRATVEMDYRIRCLILSYV